MGAAVKNARGAVVVAVPETNELVVEPLRSSAAAVGFDVWPVRTLTMEAAVGSATPLAGAMVTMTEVARRCTEPVSRRRVPQEMTTLMRLGLTPKAPEKSAVRF